MIAAAGVTPTWVNIAIGAAAALAALVSLGIIWRRFLRPTVKAVVVISEAAPTLLEIANEFKPNAGGSLHDVVDRIETRLTERTGLIDSIRVDQSTLVEHFDTLATDVQDHIVNDRAAFERIEKAQSVQVETALRVAAALKVETEDIALGLKKQTEDIARQARQDPEAPVDV